MAAMTAWLLREEGGVHPGLLADAAARPQARPAHACSVLARAEASRTRKRTQSDDPLCSGGDGGFSAVASGRCLLGGRGGGSAAGSPQPDACGRPPGLAEAAAEGGACSED